MAEENSTLAAEDPARPCNCVAEIENPENYKPDENGEIASVRLRDASIIMNKNTGKIRREVGLRIEIRYKSRMGDKQSGKVLKQVLFFNHCPFCGIKLVR